MFINTIKIGVRHVFVKQILLSKRSKRFLLSNQRRCKSPKMMCWCSMRTTKSMHAPKNCSSGFRPCFSLIHKPKEHLSKANTSYRLAIIPLLKTGLSAGQSWLPTMPQLQRLLHLHSVLHSLPILPALAPSQRALLKHYKLDKLEEGAPARVVRERAPKQGALNMVTQRAPLLKSFFGWLETSPPSLLRPQMWSVSVCLGVNLHTTGGRLTGQEFLETIFEVCRTRLASSLCQSTSQ